jgi:hypothetical protein
VPEAERPDAQRRETQADDLRQREGAVDAKAKADALAKAESHRTTCTSSGKSTRTPFDRRWRAARKLDEPRGVQRVDFFRSGEANLVVSFERQGGVWRAVGAPQELHTAQ